MNFFADHKKTNVFMGFLVFTLSAIVYCLTVSPSLCLWDCGEYLAATACLGIPHPPGTPMLIMFGKVWMLLFSFISDPGLRYNYMAVFGSSITVVFIYLIIVRALTMALGNPDTNWKRLTLYCAGFVGSLFVAFSDTFWFESLEASEQANIANVPLVISIWLALVWAMSKDPKRDKILLLIAFICFGGIGMHMFNFITAPAIFLFIMVFDASKRKDWRLWLTGVSVALIMYNLSWFIIVGSIMVVFSFIMLFLSKRNKPNWNFCFLFSLIAFIGFTNHIYLPIRASLNPIINEGDPVTWKNFREVLDRKQYGSESMISRAMWRRGSFAHQFGVEGHMGYGGFHLTQFFRFSFDDAIKNFVTSPLGWGKLLIYLIPTLFMILGWFMLYRKNKTAATLLIAVTLLTTFVMIIYMNFSDGTRAERADFMQWDKAGRPGEMPTVYREVRVRDYFYSPGFMFFAMWMGITAGLLLNFLFTHKTAIARRTYAPLVSVLFFISPVLPLAQNYKLRDRSDNWLPYEYAYNLLMTCDKNALLFTNGDNDTFPIWAIQEAYGIRKDVRLVNLSLVNTEWFIEQLKTIEPRAPISYSLAEIPRLQPELNPFETPTPYTLPTTGLKVTLPDRKQHQVLRVQDLMVLNIVDATNWTKPIYFANSVSPSNFMGLDPYLKIKGLASRLERDTVSPDERIDVEQAVFMMDSVYKLRVMPPKLTDRDEPYQGIATDYGICFQWIAMALNDRLTQQQSDIQALEAKKSSAKKLDEADVVALTGKQAEFDKTLNLATRMLDRCITLIPWLKQPAGQRHQILMNFNKNELAEKYARELIRDFPLQKEYYYLLVQALQAQGKQDKVDSVVKNIPVNAAEDR